jgi:hypothetical protein
MVNTSMAISAHSATPIETHCAVDRYRALPISIIGVSPLPAGLIDVEPRTTSPVFAAFMGEVRPDAGVTGAFLECEKSLMSWQHRGTTTIPVVGYFGKLAVDFQNRVGPPPPRRPSV